MRFSGTSKDIQKWSPKTFEFQNQVRIPREGAPAGEGSGVRAVKLFKSVDMKLKRLTFGRLFIINLNFRFPYCWLAWIHANQSSGSVDFNEQKLKYDRRGYGWRLEVAVLKFWFGMQVDNVDPREKLSMNGESHTHLSVNPGVSKTSGFTGQVAKKKSSMSDKQIDLNCKCTAQLRIE